SLVTREQRPMLLPMRIPRLVVLAAMVSSMVSFSPGLAAQAAPKGVSPEADRLLRRMSDFLGQQREFSVKVNGTTEAILRDGKKVQVEGDGVVSVKRPDRLRIDRTGDDDVNQIVYDGKTFTFYSTRQHGYVSVPAAKTIDETLSKVEASGKLE